MERKIGEIVTLPEGKRVQVTKDKVIGSCIGCTFAGHGYTFACTRGQELVRLLGPCAESYRSDHQNVIFKEVK